MQLSSKGEFSIFLYSFGKNWNTYCISVCTVPVPYHVPNAGIRLFSDCPVLKKHIFGIGPDPRAGRRGVVRGHLIFREWGERSEPTGHELHKKMIGMIIDLLPHPPACLHGAGATIPRPSDGPMSGRPDKLLHNIIYTLPTSLWYRDRRNTAQLKTRQKYFKVVSHFFYKNGSV